LFAALLGYGVVFASVYMMEITFILDMK